MTDQVPILDLKDSRAHQLQTLDTALRQYGFFYVRNHDIDPSLQFHAAASLFRLSSAQKNAMVFDPMLDIGYVGAGTQNLDPNIARTHVSGKGDVVGTAVPGDTKEQFMQTNNILITDPIGANIDPCNVFLGSKNYIVDLPNYSTITQDYANGAYALNNKLNSLLFELLALSEKHKHDLGASPFIVLKQMKYHGEISDPETGKFGMLTVPLGWTWFVSDT
jgi:isopenicillin N synthase-like dioxygenase